MVDLKLIEEKQVVERYLRGRLTPPEARFFEQVVRQSPEIVDRIGLPDTLRRMMRLLDDTGTEWRERPPRFWQQAWVPASLGAAIVLAVVMAVASWSGKRALAADYARLRTQSAHGLLVAPTRDAVLRLKAGRRGGSVPTYAIGNRTQPTLAQLRIDVGFVHATLFRIVIKRDDGTYFARLDNQLRDSNGELRLAFNSAAFAAGVYAVDIESVDPRSGETELAARLKLEVDPG